MAEKPSMNSAYRMLAGQKATAVKTAPRPNSPSKSTARRVRAKKRTPPTSSSSSSSPSPSPDRVVVQRPPGGVQRPASQSPPRMRVLHAQNYPVFAELPKNAPEKSEAVPEVKKELSEIVPAEVKTILVKEPVMERVGDQLHKVYFVDSSILHTQPQTPEFSGNILHAPAFYTVLQILVEADRIGHNRSLTAMGQNREISKQFNLNVSQIGPEDVLIVRFARFPFETTPVHARNPQNLQICLNKQSVLKLAVFLDKVPHKDLLGAPVELPWQFLQSQNELSISWTTTVNSSEEDFFLYVERAKRKTTAAVLAELTKKRLNLPGGVSRIFEMFSGGDDGIETNSSTISLVCPLSRKRIEVPVRGVSCRHVDCFDAANYLDLNRSSKAKWSCPRCSESVPWNTLIIDEFMEDVLRFCADNSVDLFPGKNSVRVQQIAKRQPTTISIADMSSSQLVVLD